MMHFIINNFTINDNSLLSLVKSCFTFHWWFLDLNLAELENYHGDWTLEEYVYHGGQLEGDEEVQQGIDCQELPSPCTGDVVEFKDYKPARADMSKPAWPPLGLAKKSPNVILSDLVSDLCDTISNSYNAKTECDSIEGLCKGIYCTTQSKPKP